MFYKNLIKILSYYVFIRYTLFIYFNETKITDCIIWKKFSNNYDFNIKFKNKIYYGTVNKVCNFSWRDVGYDVIPPFPPYLYYLNNKPICKYDGKLYFLNNDGNCNNKFGNYKVLLINKKIINCYNNLDYKNILKNNYKNFISEDEKKLFFSVTNYSMDNLFYELYNTKKSCLLKNILSKDRFVDSFYNIKGLHIFRIILADSIYHKSLLKKFNNNIPKIYKLWKKNGFLILDYEKEKYYLKEILQNISLNLELPQTMNFIKKSMIHQKKDHQYEYHMDTFHSIIKMWIYESDMKLKNGPLYFVKSSNNNDFTKLKYLFNVTKNNDLYIIREPSIRLKNKDIYKNSLYLPMLPLNNSQKTLIIADTSGFHCRGYAKEGTERNYWRPGWENNDGGLHRINFFIN